MPFAISPGVTYINTAPLFFCSPGDKDNCPDAIKSSGDLDSPKPRPAEKQLRVKILAGEDVHSEIVEIIKSAAAAWVNGLGERLGLQWCLVYDQSRATMNFAFGGWGDRKVVYSHKYIVRAAAHLFGHALGLPHARTSFSTPWNEAELVKNYDSFFGPVVKPAKGCEQLQSPQSIMGYDRPATLGSGDDEFRGGIMIDKEARKLLKALYPKSYPVSCREVTCSSAPGWSGGINRPYAYHTLEAKQTANLVTGLCRIDMGFHGWFRHKCYTQNVLSRSQYMAVLGSWDDTHLFDASYSILSLDEDDQRIQTGRMPYMDMRTSNSGLPPPGARYSKRINFARSFKKVPKVVTFISAIDSANWVNLRVELWPRDIDRNGFTLDFGPWGDTTARNMESQWLAHEPDDPSIQSGTFDNPNSYPNGTMDYRPRASYNNTMRRKPMAIFRAINYLDVDHRHNIRLEYQTPTWNEEWVEGRFFTWAEESKWYGFRGVFVAVL